VVIIIATTRDLVLDDLTFVSITQTAKAAPQNQQAEDDLDAADYQLPNEVWRQIESLLSPHKKLTVTWGALKSKS
jgi:hypothetical protein